MKRFASAAVSIVLVACMAGCSEATTDPADAIAGFTGPDLTRLSVTTKQVEQAEAIRAIKRLQRAYAQYLSAGRWDDAVALFAETGSVELPVGAVGGSGGIRSYLQERFGFEAGENRLSFGRLNEQLILSPVINLDASGTRANGRWRLVALEGQFGESAGFQGGIFENEYVYEGGSWKIAVHRFFAVYAGPYEAGWRNLKEETAEDVTPIPYHYDADLAGIPAPQIDADSPIEVTLTESEAAATLTTLEARVDRMLDEQAVINLQNAYGYYVDRHLWDDAADLFTDSGTLELGLTGVYRGRQSIRRRLEQFGPAGLPADVVNDHLQLQPVAVISADGRTARVRGTELQMRGRFQEEASWGLATFDNTFVKIDDVWQIQSVHVYTRMQTDYDRGWGEYAAEPPAASNQLSADDAPTVEYAAYPEFYAPEFGFEAASIAGTFNIATAADPATATLPLSDRLGELERKIQQLNAYDGAENVSNAYGYYIDEFLWDGMADLFATDGWKELSYIGTYIGRERVRQSVVSRYGRGGRRPNSMTFHQKVQPVISVADDGMSAKIRTRLFQLNSSLSEPGSYISGIYENQVVIEDGIWKILAMDLDYQWTANYADGWHNVAPTASTQFAPEPGSLQGEDAPDRGLRGVTYAPYPLAQVDMAFHYLNPVSGREPPILLDDSQYQE